MRWPYAAGGITLVVLFAALYFQSPDIPVAGAASFAEKQRFWEKRIAHIGTDRAYAQLVDAVAGLPTATQHHEAHAFGNALYFIKGLDGISACDNRFLYGCFHAFAIKGVINEGVESIHTMNEACHDVLGKNVGQCQHGIGHGVLATLGYSIDDLKKALAVCATLEYPDHLFGCNGGALMEYGLQGMLEEDAPPRPLLDAKDAVEPCASLEEPFLEPCAYWQNQWWVAARFKQDRSTLAQEMGAWCKLLPGGEPAYRACIRGIGNKMQVLTGEDASKAHAICNLVSDQPTYRYICQKESATRFLYYHPLSEALKACDGLPSDENNECRRSTKRWATNFDAKDTIAHE